MGCKMDNREQAIESNMGLVHACAKRFRGRGIEYDDLVQAGCLGLVKAVDHFDEGRGLQFSTYAVPVILGEMRRLFRDGGAIKVGRALKELSLKAARACNEFSLREGRQPTISELAEQLGVEPAEASQALGASQQPLSLSADEENGGGQIDVPTEAPEEKISELIALKQVVGELDPRDRSLIVMRFFKSRTQTQTCLLYTSSSALWPFSTLGWPEKTPELSYFYPTDTLVTGYDIIFFWVARMIFSGLEHMGDIPFKTVFFHGLVRDAQGRKMSKSLGNGIDPIEVIEKYGADALRFTLVTGNSPGNDMRFTEEKLESSRNFANKIWNAARFIHMNIDGFDVKNELPESLTLEDQWIVSALNTVTKEVTENLEKYELGIAVQKLYDFIWDQFCDWYIELAKTRLMAKDETSVGARQVLVWTFTSILKLMHPFMPYITEEIWQTMPHEGEALMAADYLIYNEKYAYPQAEAEMHRIMETIRAIRNRRAEMNVPPSRRAKVYVASSFEETFRKGAQFVARLAYASEVEVGEAFSIPGAVTIVTADAKVYIPMDELVDKEAELKRLNKELETAQKQLDQVNAKLNNPGFTGKAPANVVEGARQNAQKLEDKIKMIASSIEALNG